MADRILLPFLPPRFATTAFNLACGLALASVASCSSDDAGNSAAACSDAAPCPAGKLCLFGGCSVACKQDRDCALGERCLRTNLGAACVTPTAASCTGACPPGSFCANGQ